MSSINPYPDSHQNMHYPRAQSSQSNLKADFLKFFGAGNNANQQSKKVTRDGQPAKRRGPKPDSKPAMTRRQELNRQAQRTHRERKEQYMRALETEVSRLREAYTQEISAANVNLQQQRHALHAVTEENDILKEILSAHGIAYEAEVERRRANRPRTAAYQSSPFASSLASSAAAPPASNSNVYTTPPTTVASSLSPNGGEHSASPKSEPVSRGSHAVSHGHSHEPGCLDMGGMDLVQAVHPVEAIQGVFETDPQLQIDFILTLESPCREHTDYLCRRSVVEADDEDMPFSGHALMATCPPPSYIANTTGEAPYPHKTYDLPHANLSTLLNLSRHLVTEGQITPIMALQCLKQHDLYRSLTRDDIRIIIETLNTKVRCYGFGAVMEDFELADCLSSVLGTKVDAAYGDSRDDFMYS